MSERLLLRQELLTAFNEGKRIVGFDPRKADYLLL
jgi:chorismate synthase